MSPGGGVHGALLRAVALGLMVASFALAGPATATAQRGVPTTVTLVTGDRVTLVPSPSGSPEVRFEPAPGSERTGFTVERDGERVRVVPRDVAPLVGDTLDPALFDVTALAEMGYDDPHSSTLPLIVQGGAARQGRALRSIGATAIELRKGARRSWATTSPGADRVWLDRTLEPTRSIRTSRRSTRPPPGTRGSTAPASRWRCSTPGVDEGHPALAGQVDARANFTDAPSAEDGNGHGTHVASLLGGTGAGSGGARQGIATGADLISGKVLADSGEGRESWVIAGMEWAAAQGADVVNLSLGGSSGERDDPLSRRSST